MSVLVVDASVVIKWLVPEIHALAAGRLLEAGAELIAPDLLFAEVANTMWKKARRGELTSEIAQELVDDLPRIAVQTFPCRDLASEAHAVAIATGRSVYDSMYLALAIRLDTRLVTADERLVNAIRATPMLASHIRFVAEM